MRSGVALSAFLVAPERPAGGIRAGTLAYWQALDIHEISKIGEVFSVEHDRLGVVGDGRHYRGPSDDEGQNLHRPRTRYKAQGGSFTLSPRM